MIKNFLSNKFCLQIKWLTLLLLLPFGSSMVAEEGILYHNDQLGIQTILPKKNWVFYDQSVGDVKIFIYTLKKDFTTRFAIIVLPQNNIAGGMKVRAQEIARDAGKFYQEIAIKSKKLAGKEAEQLIYSVGSSKIIEYGVNLKPYYMIIQVAAPIKSWEQKNQKQTLENIFEKFKWIGSIRYKAEFDLTSTEEIVRRREQIAQYPFSIISHNINVLAEPQKTFLAVEDSFWVRANQDDVSRCKFYFSLSDIDKISSLDQNHKISWRWEKTKKQTTGSLFIEITPALKEGECLPLYLKAHSDRFLFQTTSAIRGQIKPQSSFSSHVFYYPIDPKNTASTKLSFNVPTGYQVVASGNLTEKKQIGKRIVFSFANDSTAHHSLPLGFAIARYHSLKTQTSSGISIEIYGFSENLQSMKWYLDLAIKSANTLEQILGPPLIKKIAIVHIMCDKELAVNLPGMILLSSHYWQKIPQITLSQIKFDLPEAENILVMVRELSAQWCNSLSLSNELAEGMTNFINLLFIEKHAGKDAYRQGINFCKATYVTGSKGAKDFAIANPDLTKAKKYQNVVYCKIPIVFDMLRTLLGDKDFFAGWQSFFANRKEQPEYDKLKEIFSQISGQKLDWFFRQWFFQSGYPQIQISWQQRQPNVFVTLEQKQKQPLFQLESRLRLKLADGKFFYQDITLSEQKQTFIIVIPKQVVEVKFDTDNALLWEHTSIEKNE